MQPQVKFEKGLYQQYHKPQRNMTLKRCQAEGFFCAHSLGLKRCFQLETEKKLRRHVASTITPPLMIHHRKNKLTKPFSLSVSWQKACVKLIKKKKKKLCLYVAFPPEVFSLQAKVFPFLKYNQMETVIYGSETGWIDGLYLPFMRHFWLHY